MHIMWLSREYHVDIMWVSCGYHVGIMGIMWISWISCGCHEGIMRFVQIVSKMSITLETYQIAPNALSKAQ